MTSYGINVKIRLLPWAMLIAFFLTIKGAGKRGVRLVPGVGVIVRVTAGERERVRTPQVSASSIPCVSSQGECGHRQVHIGSFILFTTTGKANPFPTIFFMVTLFTKESEARE